MSELLNAKNRGENFRRKLLANVSMLALLGYFGTSQSAALAADDDPPTLWIELGGQAERAVGMQQIFEPAFADKAAAADRKPLIDAQRPPPFSIGGEGKITFMPSDTNWVLSASIHYGRADSAKHLHQQTAPPYVERYFGTQLFPPPNNQQFGDAQTDFKESHAVLDFQAGKDVGLGLFGTGGKSVVSAGVRFAQFTSSSDVSLHGRQYKLGAAYSATKYLHYASPPGVFGYRTVNTYRHDYGAILQTRRNTHAVGPSISWDASLSVARSSSDMTLNFDWGLNAAILFGRQRAQIHHQTSGQYKAQVGPPFKYPYRHYKQSSYTHAPVDLVRSRTVTIPNVGGFAGATYRIANFKVSLGYRADFFFGAMDSGIDTAKKENVGFYGPFATISVGLGG